MLGWIVVVAAVAVYFWLGLLPALGTLVGGGILAVLIAQGTWARHVKRPPYRY